MYYFISNTMKYVGLFLTFSSCYAMDHKDHEAITIPQEQPTTAPVLVHAETQKNYSLDALRLEKFVTDVLPKQMQDPFVTDVNAKEWQKFALIFERDSNQWYKDTMSSVQQESLLSPEEKNTLCMQILAKSLMYRCTTSKGHKVKKHESMQQTQTYQKTSVASAVIGGAITVVTNLLQHFLTKK